MYEGVSVEKILEIHCVISVGVLKGLSFAPRIGAEAWGPGPFPEPGVH